MVRMENNRKWLHSNIAKKQKRALEEFIGSVAYDEAFDPKRLDLDLAKKIKK